MANSLSEGPKCPGCRRRTRGCGERDCRSERGAVWFPYVRWDFSGNGNDGDLRIGFPWEAALSANGSDITDRCPKAASWLGGTRAFLRSPYAGFRSWSAAFRRTGCGTRSHRPPPRILDLRCDLHPDAAVGGTELEAVRAGGAVRHPGGRVPVAADEQRIPRNFRRVSSHLRAMRASFRRSRRGRSGLCWSGAPLCYGAARIQPSSRQAGTVIGPCV